MLSSALIAFFSQIVGDERKDEAVCERDQQPEAQSKCFDERSERDESWRGGLQGLK